MPPGVCGRHAVMNFRVCFEARSHSLEERLLDSSVRPSVCPVVLYAYGRLPHDGFPLNLILGT